MTPGLKWLAYMATINAKDHCDTMHIKWQTTKFFTFTSQISPCLSTSQQDLIFTSILRNMAWKRAQIACELAHNMFPIGKMKELIFRVVSVKSHVDY